MRRIDASSLELEERVVKTNKCQKTHKGGRTLSWNALVVVGDGQGHVGAAMGKARGIPDAVRHAAAQARASRGGAGPWAGPAEPRTPSGRPPRRQRRC